MSEFASLETENALRLLNSTARFAQAADGLLLTSASKVGVVA